MVRQFRFILPKNIFFSFILLIFYSFDNWERFSKVQDNGHFIRGSVLQSIYILLSIKEVLRVKNIQILFSHFLHHKSCIEVSLVDHKKALLSTVCEQLVNYRVSEHDSDTL